MLWWELIRKKCSLCISSDRSESTKIHCTFRLQSVTGNSKKWQKKSRILEEIWRK